MTVSYPLVVSALLALNYGLADAKPMPDGAAKKGLATLNLQPVKIVAEVPVSLTTHCPQPTDLIICDGHTIHITRPGWVQTETTITHTYTSTIAR